MNRYFEYEHVPTFVESNLVGNIYFARYLEWQGKCRELFILKEAPALLETIYPRGSLALVTMNCSCQFYKELLPMKGVRIEMRLLRVQWAQITMSFKYFDEDGDLAAEGVQQVSCKERVASGALHDLQELPDPLAQALSRYEVQATVGS